MSGPQHNSVLKDFLDMRRALHKTGAPPPVSSAIQTAEKKTGKKLGKTKEAASEELFGMSVAKIIEEKPNKKEICEYFQKECDKLTAEKMK